MVSMAVKVIISHSKHSNKLIPLIKEGVETIQSTNCDAIAKIYDAYYCSTGVKNGLYITMKYYPKGDLKNFIKNRSKLPQHFVTSVAGTIFKALSHCHSHEGKFMHRDISTNNILVEEYSNGAVVVVVNDFDTIKSIEDNDIHTE
jgi:serine/threonine protein kinase